MKKKNRSIGINAISGGTNALFSAFFILYAIICVLPLVVVLSVSLTDEVTLLDKGYSIFPQMFSIEAYQFILKDPWKMLNAFGISIFVSIIGSLLGLILTLFYAYPLYRKDFPFRNFFAFFLFLTMLFNGGLVPFYIVYTRFLHLKDSIMALIVPYLISPFLVIIMRTYLTMTVPQSLVESAMLDGASEVRTLFRIILPISLPAIATVTLFSLLTYWNDWWLSLIFITSDSKVNLQFLLYKILMNIKYLFMLRSAGAQIQIGSIKVPQENLRMAMAILSIGPILFAYPFFQRYFVKGLTIGAVKG